MKTNDLFQWTRTQLIDWAARHPRPLPWKGIRKPYQVWLSEIILQQTRVEQGLPYYERFLEACPTIEDLARLSENELFKLWEGLGYYSRARNMHATARFIAHELQGIFPNQYADIRALKGVGDYTAAAIASFAFDLPHAVLDGNVYRVLSRFMGVTTPIDASSAKREYSALAQSLLDEEHPGAWNQIMMDFGATWCTPRNPKCADCPLREKCVALSTGQVESLPVKSKKMEKKERFFVYFILKSGENRIIRQRTAKDIWQGLWEFPSLETDRLSALQNWDDKQTQQWLKTWLPSDIKPVHISPATAPRQQILTHRIVSAVFCEITFESKDLNHLLMHLPENGFVAMTSQQIQSGIAFPKLIQQFVSGK